MHNPLHPDQDYRQPHFPGQHDRPCVNPSIRAQLEADAWRRHPRLARKLARQRLRPSEPRRRLRWQDRTLLTLGIVLLALVLLRVETAAAQQEDWGLTLLGDQAQQVRLALQTQVRADVSGLAARVEITQRFRNDGGKWAEAIYRFPLPPGAAVDRLRVQVGERVIVGEIQEKESAERVYQQARSEGRTASLVRQERPNQFETRLANIGPGEDIHVTIGFLVNVEFAEGAFGLRLPMTFTPRWDPPTGGGAPRPGLAAATARPDHLLDLEVFLHTGIGYAAIESRYHDVEISPEAQGYRVTLANRTAMPDRAFELSWFPDLQAVPQSALLTWDSGDAVYAQLMLVPPLNDAVAPRPRELVFIIDTSGSMEGASIEQARAALLRGLEELGPQDRFNLVRFNSDTELLFPASVPVSRSNLATAEAWIRRLRANGGTVMAPALRAAFTLPEQPGLLRQVVFVTDGSVGNESELLAAIAADLEASRLFTVSIGSAPNSGFMRKAAEIGRGSHTHIGRLDEVEERMARLWTHIRVPALSDICVDWGVDAEFYPEIIPDLYAGEPLWVVARMPLDPGQITLCGTLDGRPWQQVTHTRAAAGDETLATLWARRKIEALEDGMVFGADPEFSREEVLRVALEYGLLTSQTSLVAVDRTPARPTDETLARGEIPSLLPAGSSSRLAGFPATATGWRVQLALSLLSLLVVSWLYWATAVTPSPHVVPVRVARRSRSAS